MVKKETTTTKKKTTTKEKVTKGKTLEQLNTLYGIADMVVTKIDENISMYTQGNKLESLNELPESMSQQVQDRQKIAILRGKIFNEITKKLLEIRNEDITRD